MKTYLIALESAFPETPVINKIKSFQLWARPMTNVWLIKSTSDRVSIYNYLLTGTFFTGKILVISVSDDWISKNLAQEVVKWMQGGL